jgi:hypothetical protein
MTGPFEQFMDGEQSQVDEPADRLTGANLQTTVNRALDVAVANGYDMVHTETSGAVAVDLCTYDAYLQDQDPDEVAKCVVCWRGAQ